MTKHQLLKTPTTSFDIGELVKMAKFLRDEFGTVYEVIKSIDNNTWVYLKGFKRIKNTTGLPST